MKDLRDEIQTPRNPPRLEDLGEPQEEGLIMKTKAKATRVAAFKKKIPLVQRVTVLEVELKAVKDQLAVLMPEPPKPEPIPDVPPVPEPVPPEAA